jgi:hypothetical protein
VWRVPVDLSKRQLLSNIDNLTETSPFDIDIYEPRDEIIYTYSSVEISRIHAALGILQVEADVLPVMALTSVGTSSHNAIHIIDYIIVESL